MTSLLIGLSGRLARTETELETACSDTDEKKSLERKREKLLDQLTEAKKLQGLKDKMGDRIVVMLKKYLSQAELEQYDKFVTTKVRLIMELKEVEDKIKLGEEQLSALS